MSIFKLHMDEHKGFYKTYWISRKWGFDDSKWNHRMSPAKPQFTLFRGKHHRRMGSGVYNRKVFDVGRAKVFNRFKDKTCVPSSIYAHSQLGWFNVSRTGHYTKFQYRR